MQNYNQQNQSEKQNEKFSRTQKLIGKNALLKLQSSSVLIFGVGGVGGFACEALARAGIGAIDIVDNDVVALSNINRQIIALESTLGLAKVDVMKNRILDINPHCVVKTFKKFVLPENMSDFDFSKYDYVVDAIDTLTAKIAIIECAKKANANVISAMGAGNKTDPTKFRIADISETSVCPLARIVRHELKKRNIKNVKVVFSTENPVKRDCTQQTHCTETTAQTQAKQSQQMQTQAKTSQSSQTQPHSKENFPASISFVPSVAGLIIASEVVNNLIKSVPSFSSAQGE